ncbi:hypothetical protein LTS15_002075 [Exophiala xenobiotica]|nr:hypothetical protein LTS15_002075 [Exophiala xenobiotica]
MLEVDQGGMTDEEYKEVNRRVWWTLRMIHVWSSNGVRIPRALGATNDSDLPYPMNEIILPQVRRSDDGQHIDHLSNTTSATLTQESGSSLLTQMVKLNALLAEISSVNQTAAAASYGHSPDYNGMNHQVIVDRLA